MVKKTVTIEDLAGMVQKGFSEFGDKLEREISNLRTELKDEISSVRTELKDEISGLRNDFYSFRAETRDNFSDLKGEISDIKLSLAKVEKRTLVDDGVLSGEIIELGKRTSFLEKKFKQIQTA